MSVNKINNISFSYRLIINILFFIIGIGCTIAWNSITFSVSYFTLYFNTINLGNISWTLLLLSYNIPGLPIQIIIYIITKNTLQSQAKRYFIIRIIPLFIILSCIIFIFPFSFIIINNIWICLIIIIIMVLIIGICQSFVYSFVFQFASLFSQEIYSTIPCCLGGIGFSTFILLLLTIIEKYDTSNVSFIGLIIYYTPLSIFPIISCFSVFILYIINNKQDDNNNNDDFEVELEQVITEEIITDNNIDNDMIDSFTIDDNISFLTILSIVKIPCIAIIITGFNFVLYSATVPFLNSNNNMHLPSILLYIQAICYFIGNITAAFIILFKYKWSIIIGFVIQIILFFPIYFHDYYFQYDSHDIILCIISAIFTLLGSYVGSCSYVVTSNLVSLEYKTNAISLLNISLYIGYIMGLIINLIIILS